MGRFRAGTRHCAYLSIGIGLLLASTAVPDTAFAQRGLGSLPDVKPGDWAYTALNTLAQRHNCLPGGQRLNGRTLARYEFATSLSTCLAVMDGKAQRPGAVGSQDQQTVQRLRWSFAAELSALRAHAESWFEDPKYPPSAISPIDFGGGNKMGFMLRRLDPVLVGGGYNTGLISNRIGRLVFDEGRGSVSFYGQFNNAFVDVNNGNPNGDNTNFSTNGASQNF